MNSTKSYFNKKSFYIVPVTAFQIFGPASTPLLKSFWLYYIVAMNKKIGQNCLSIQNEDWRFCMNTRCWSQFLTALLIKICFYKGLIIYNWYFGLWKFAKKYWISMKILSKSQNIELLWKYLTKYWTTTKYWTSTKHFVFLDHFLQKNVCILQNSATRWVFLCGKIISNISKSIINTNCW